MAARLRRGDHVGQAELEPGDLVRIGRRHRVVGCPLLVLHLAQLPPAPNERPQRNLAPLVEQRLQLADRGLRRRRVEQAKARLLPIAAALKTETKQEVLERVHALYGYVGKG